MPCFGPVPANSLARLERAGNFRIRWPSRSTLAADWYLWWTAKRTGCWSLPCCCQRDDFEGTPCDVHIVASTQISNISVNEHDHEPACIHWYSFANTWKFNNIVNVCDGLALHWPIWPCISFALSPTLLFGAVCLQLGRCRRHDCSTHMNRTRCRHGSIRHHGLGRYH